MGCVFCSLGSIFVVILEALERISMWTLCAMVICCLAITITIVLLIGIGIGYHYCYANYVGHPDTNKTSPTNLIHRAISKVFKQNIHRITRRELEGDKTIANLTNIGKHTETQIPLLNVTKSFSVF